MSRDDKIREARATLQMALQMAFQAGCNLHKLADPNALKLKGLIAQALAKYDQPTAARMQGAMRPDSDFQPSMESAAAVKKGKVGEKQGVERKRFFWPPAPEVVAKAKEELKEDAAPAETSEAVADQDGVSEDDLDQMIAEDQGGEVEKEAGQEIDPADPYRHMEHMTIEAIVADYDSDTLRDIGKKLAAPIGNTKKPEKLAAMIKAKLAE